jgi:hypothetical protein
MFNNFKKKRNQFSWDDWSLINSFYRLEYLLDFFFLFLLDKILKDFLIILIFWFIFKRVEN